MSLHLARPVPSTGARTSRACEAGFISRLLTCCGRGEPAALDGLMVLFYPIARQLLQDRPDAIEAAFVSLWEAAPSYRPERESAVAWIVRHLTSEATQPGAW